MGDNWGKNRSKPSPSFVFKLSGKDCHFVAKGIENAVAWSVPGTASDLQRSASHMGRPEQEMEAGTVAPRLEQSCSGETL